MDTTRYADPILHLRPTPGGVAAAGEPEARLGDTRQRLAPFAEWHWDGQRLEARIDRLGLYRLYYWVADGGIALSSSVQRLVELGAPAELDDAAVAAFLRLGFFLGEDTPFRAVRALPPAGVLSWTRAGVQVAGERPRVRVAEIGRQAAIARYTELFRQSIRRRLPEGAAVVPLSGGRDSRHILMELVTAGVRPLALTSRYFPPRGDADVRAAVRVARAVGVEHVIIEQPHSQLAAVVRHLQRSNLATLCTSYNQWSVADYLHEHGVPTVYDGIGGALSAAGFLDAEVDARHAAGEVEAAARQIVDKGLFHAGYTEPRLRQLLAPATYARFSRSLALRRIAAELERYADDDIPLRAFIFFGRTSRDIGLLPTRVYQGVPQVHTPYLDHDVFDFLFSLPPQLAADRELHTDTIRHAYPQWAELPYASGGGRPRDAHRRLRLAGEFVRHFVRRPARLRWRWRYVLPRIARQLADPRYSGLGQLAAVLVFLEEVERLQERHPGAAAPAAWGAAASAEPQPVQ